MCEIGADLLFNPASDLNVFIADIYDCIVTVRELQNPSISKYKLPHDCEYKAS